MKLDVLVASTIVAALLTVLRAPPPPLFASFEEAGELVRVRAPEPADDAEPLTERAPPQPPSLPSSVVSEPEARGAPPWEKSRRTIRRELAAVLNAPMGE